MTLPLNRLTRRSLLAGLAGTAAAALSTTAAGARAPETSRLPRPRPSQPAVLRGAGGLQAQSLETLMARANLGGVTGFIALDAETGAVIEAHQPDAALPPASVAKAPTALFALHALGTEHRFPTRLLLRGGSVSGGVLRGDLVLEGGGDPTLQTEDLARLADALVAQGVRRVEGRLLVDGQALPQLDWIAADQPVQAGYNPALGGLNLNYNRVHFLWERQGGQMRLSLDARSNREVPPVSVISIQAQDRASPVYTYAEGRGVEQWSVARPALGTGGSRWLPVRRPALYAGDVLRVLLASRGCTVPAPQLAGSGSGGTVLAEHRSAPLSGMMREMLRWSTNITAECAGISAARRQAAGVTTLAQSGQRMGAWIGQRYGAAGLNFTDHSGLGEGARVTARAMAQFFQAAGHEGMLPGLLRRHTMRDSQGREQPDHPVRVDAKTGTLNFVNALGGYASTGGGRRIVFAILSADLARRSAIAPEARDRPPGGREWAGRARQLQQGLIERWAALHG